ncbi:MAG: hypothetical protein RBJ76_26760 [Stenomitos frigidus ULC029]
MATTPATTSVAKATSTVYGCQPYFKERHYSQQLDRVPQARRTQKPLEHLPPLISHWGKQH